MIQIREGMFETNSSSTHSIVVTKQKTEPGLFVDFKIGEFGWGFYKYESTDDKASYLYTLACDCLGRDVYQDLYEVLVKYGVNCTCSVPARFKRTDSYNYLENGYVDHPYEGKEFVDAMLSHEKALIKYLFSEESFVVTGNDNCDETEYYWFSDQKNVNYPHTEYYKGN